jgi:hypothetical protein
VPACSTQAKSASPRCTASWRGTLRRGQRAAAASDPPQAGNLIRDGLIARRAESTTQFDFDDRLDGTDHLDDTTRQASQLGRRTRNCWA